MASVDCVSNEAVRTLTVTPSDASASRFCVDQDWHIVGDDGPGTADWYDDAAVEGWQGDPANGTSGSAEDGSGDDPDEPASVALCCCSSSSRSGAGGTRAWAFEQAMGLVWYYEVSN